jgi:hypothetical protein
MLAAQAEQVPPGRAAEEVTVPTPSDPRDAELIELSHSISRVGQAVVHLGGELDFASAEAWTPGS